MNTLRSAEIVHTTQINALIHVGRRNAYHQAGYAAAIYLGNQHKQLPAVHFQISIKPCDRDSRFSGRILRIPDKYAAKVEGGRLLQSLPQSFTEATRHLSPTEQQLCRSAIEADITNLLAGPLAEAKHVALRDGEVFNANLVYLGALQFYGGKPELETINELMACYLPDEAERKQKLAELFLVAYSFVNEPANWRAITALAEAVCAAPKDTFTCEEIMALLTAATTASLQKTAFLQ
jgi:hypothetical protein